MNQKNEDGCRTCRFCQWWTRVTAQEGACSHHYGNPYTNQNQFCPFFVERLWANAHRAQAPPPRLTLQRRGGGLIRSKDNE